MKPYLVLALVPALLLAACNRETTPPATPLSGTVVNGGLDVDASGNFVLKTSAWTGGTGTVTVSAVNQDVSTALGTVALAADGTFSFASLPTPAAALLVPPVSGPTAAGCTESVVVSDPAARGVAANFTVAAGTSGTITPLTIDSANQTLQTTTLLYMDRAVTLKGLQTCATAPVTTTADIDVKLGKGWNTLIVSQKSTGGATSSTISTTIRNGSFGAAKWIVITNLAQPLRLKSAPLPSFSLFR